MDDIYPNLPLQRCNLASVYYACTMLFHRSLPYAQPAPLQQLPQMALTGLQYDLDCRKLASLASELLRVQRTMLDHTNRSGRRQPHFLQTFLIFEAAVTLSIALRREPTSLYAEEWQKERQSAVDMLESMKDRDAGDIVRQGILVLRVLQGSKQPQGQSGLPSDTVAMLRQQIDMVRPMDFTMQNVPSLAPASSSSSMAMPVWHTSLDSCLSGIPCQGSISMLPNEMLQSLQLGMEWTADGVNGTVNSFNLLHGFDK